MTLKDKVGRGLKNLVCGGLIAGSLIFGGYPKIARADNMPLRELTINSTSPTKSSEANTETSYSLNQLTGKLNDYLGIKKNMDSNFLKRSALFVGNIAPVFLTMVLSHEFGHLKVAEKYGKGELHFNWGGSLRAYVKPHNLNDEEDLRMYIAGINQNMLNARFINSKNPDKITYDNAFLSLFNSEISLNYARIDGKRKINSSDSGDINLMREELEKKGINLSRNETIKQTALGTFLNPQTYENLGACLNYLINEERETNKHTISLGKNEISLPEIYHFWTPKGGFYELNATLNPKSKENIELTIGSDADSMGGGKLSTKIIGAKLNYSLSEYFIISPSVNLDFAKGKPNGYSTGFELTAKTSKNSKLILKIKNSRNDILENVIKDNSNGINASLKYSVGF